MNENTCMGVLHSFSIENIFYDKMNLRLFIFMWRNNHMKLLPYKAIKLLGKS